MEYQPLALKYRPQRFADVVGQEVASTALRNAITGGRIAHAYLFAGMRGVGKTSVARILAKSLNCLESEGPTTEPCDRCASCTEIMASRSIDVLEIDGASNTSVDDVRSLQENLLYAPARDRYKIYIVDEVHMLSKSAFNAFLKTLEEPPQHAVFIFATTEIHRIPPTVLSRCMLFEFGRVSSAAIAERLREICRAESIELEEAAVDLLVFASEGSIRDAISALDQAVNYSGQSISYGDALRALGMIGRDALAGFFEAVIEQDAEAAFNVVAKVAAGGADMRMLCRQLIRHVRDLLVARIGGEDTALLPYSDSERALLMQQSKRVSEEDLSRFFDILVRTEAQMQLSASAQFHLEAAAVKMIHSTRLTPLTELIAQVQSGRAGQQAHTAVGPSPIEQQLQFDAPRKTGSTPMPGASDKNRLLAAARGSHIHPMLRAASAVSASGNRLSISFTSASMAGTFANGSEGRLKLVEAARQAFGPETEIVVSTESENSLTPPDQTTPSAQAAPDEPPPPEEPAPPPEPPAEAFEHELGGSVSAETERRVREDPLAGRLLRELDGTVLPARDGPQEEEEKQ